MTEGRILNFIPKYLVYPKTRASPTFSIIQVTSELKGDTRLGPLPIGPPGYRAWNTRVYATSFICGVAL